MNHTYALAKEGLLSRVFIGLFSSLVAAFIGIYAGQYVPPQIVPVLMIGELVMIFAAMFLRRSRRIGMPFVLVFTFVSGITLYPVIAYYTMLIGATTVLEAVGVTAASFLVSAIVASRTSFDFSFLGGFLFIGLIAILLMGLVSIFIPFSTVANLVYTTLGIAIFVGYILFDINRIAHMGISQEQIPWVVLSLYLDILNLFLFILRLFGVLQSSRR